MTRKTRNWRRVPGRRTTAAVLTAALAATGLTFIGLGLDDPASRDGSGREAKAKPVTEAAAMARATKTGKSVEVTALRTARSTTWARPDGLMARNLYSSPIRAKVDGEWRDIDYDLHRTRAGWEPRATNARIVFSAGSAARDEEQRASRSTVRRVSLVGGAKSVGDETASPLVALTVDGHEIQLTWPGTVPVPIIDGSRALYPEIFPGADLVLTADDDGFAQLLVLKNRQAAADPRARQISYGITSPTLNFRLDPVTGVLTAEDVFATEVAMSPTPLMWDNSGQPAVTDGSVGATAQPTTPESPAPTESATDDPSESPSPTGELIETDEQADTAPETLPAATDGPEPSVSEAPLPSAPAEPTPAPSQTGSAATLSLSGLDGPSPDSRGELVEAGLTAAKWVLTPDLAFLDDPATTYPVFIDPSVKKHTQNWTTAYSRHPNATFYNGKGFNKGGTHEARVGFESDTWGTSRSYFNIAFDKDLKGTKITSAKLRMLETYSWSCSARAMSVHLTGPVNGKTNWKNAPKLHDGNKFATKSFAHGYKSGCRDAYETFDVKKAAQKRADQGKDTITFGLRARDEHSQYAWKKFQANGDHAPVLELVYNRRPTVDAKSLDLGPDAKCTTTEPYVRMSSGDLTFTARASDKDQNLDHLDFDLWPHGKWQTTGDLLGSTGKVSVGGDKGTALRTTAGFSTSKLTNGTRYSWRVRAVDDAGTSSSYAPAKTPCRFVLDTAAPRPPKVSSTDFPNADGSENGFGNDAEDANWSTKKFGTPGSFTVRALNSDVVRYEYGFNSPSYTGSLTRAANTATSVSATISNAKPPTAGPNVLYVRAVDSAGNPSEPTKYFFYVTPRDQADAPGDFTGDKLPDMMVVTEAGNLAMYPSQATTDLTKGTGDLDYSMPGAYRANPEKDPNGDDLPPYVPAPSGHFKGALITHNGDIYGGDGLQDLVVRVGGKLWVYPGDGYGAVNIDKRREILLPEGAPSPADLTQFLSAGDATKDGRTDFFATIGDELWVFTGYHGATIDKATRLWASGWAGRDIVTALDVSGDGVTDLVYRSDASGRLLLRKGIAAAGGGVDLASLASAGSSAGGEDSEYGASGWAVSSFPLLMGTPDANGDGIPDVWGVRYDGSVRFYAGGRTTVAPGSGTEVIAPASYWKTRIAIG
ncbi:DNRLRE domain-containing protein [Streptomyces viridochromogenes]|uniref:Putative secreted protein n=1 Tax=Streptomyces viridochromogenes Tue57 TaxID=1160705 RepID=L8PB43_STRVR|nr:DNRLRE domain-containing protein [Streptomyces viridochromogenes]ELS53610.1 putative secreted protein [Streptomyces viridochromogenes Tue57]